VAKSRAADAYPVGRLFGDAEAPAAAYAVALSTLPGMGPARLAAVLRRWEPREAWERVARDQAASEPAVAATCRGDAVLVGRMWARAASGIDVAAMWRRHEAAGVGVHVFGHDSYPKLLSADPEAPAVLFSLGDFAALSRRRVAIVGTRRCTRYGRDMARELGRDLAAAGVTVVSGLALGVDGAAHGGVLEAGVASEGAGAPVAVVASGLDVVYPRRNAGLWSDVAAAGLLLSEAPLGTSPEGWRFPVRNRVIAGLAEVVVVVESHSKGGSLHTVESANARGIPVMAVPGSVRSPASAFSNSLLADGCAPVRDAVDVLVALGLSCASGTAASVETRPPPGPDGAAVLAAIEWEPATLDEIVGRAALGPAQASVALEALERDGWIVSHGGWWEQVPAGVARSLGALPGDGSGARRRR
jgi:DNA processing protein